MTGNSYSTPICLSIPAAIPLSPGLTEDPCARTRTVPSRLLVWSAMWVIYVVWGSTYLGIRVMDETIPPFVGASARFLLVGLIMAAFIVVKRGPGALRVSARELGSLAVVGALLLVGGNGLLVYAER